MAETIRAGMHSEDKFSLIPIQSGEYVHFSDRLTGALKNINDVIEDNKGTLDSIQDMALELTRAISVLRNVAIQYIQQVDKVLEVVAPIVNKMPLFPEKIKDFINDALELSNKIMEASDIAKEVLPEVEKKLAERQHCQPAVFEKGCGPSDALLAGHHQRLAIGIEKPDKKDLIRFLVYR